MPTSVLSCKRFRAIHAVALTATIASFCSLGRPANADGAASTRNIILGAAAATAAVIINNNVVHKHQLRDEETDYARYGDSGYGNGERSYPEGRYSRDGRRHHEGNRYGEQWEGHRSDDGDRREHRYRD
jgi:hypothetical protein